MTPLKTLADWHDAMRAARVVRDHSLAGMVPRKNNIRRSKKMASLSALPTSQSSGTSEHGANRRLSSPSRVTKSDCTVSEFEHRPSEEHKLQLFVNCSLRSSICLQLHPSTTIAALKGFVQDELGIKPEKQHLFTRRNVELLDANSLEDHGIEQDTNVELRLVSGLMGGTGEQKSTGKDRREEGTCQQGAISTPEQQKRGQEQAQTNQQKQDVTPVPSTSSPSRVSSVLRNVFQKNRRHKKMPGLGETKGQQEMVTLPEQQRQGQETDDPNRQPSPEHHQAADKSQAKPPSRIQTVLQRVVRKKCRHKQESRPGEQRCEQGTMLSPEQQQLGREQIDGANRNPSLEHQPSVISHQDIVQSAHHPVTQHSSTDVDVPHTSSSLLPTAQDNNYIRCLNISGDHNPCFFGPVSGTFNVTVVSATTDQGCDRQPHCLDAVLENLQSSSQDASKQGFATGLLSTDSGINTPPIPHAECSSTRTGRDARPAQVAADSCEEALKTWYTTTGSYVQMIPWVDDDTKHIMDIYTSLQLVNDYQDGKLKSYHAIFLVKTREGNVIKRILMNGLAGVGKSTLIDKMSYDWAIKCAGVLQEYKLVFALKMHSLEQNSELIDSVFDQLLDQDTSIDRRALKSFIDTNPEKVLILLDGFDEFMTTQLHESSFGSILRILNRKEGRDCCVVITTRSSHVSRLVSKLLVQKPFTHVKVLGFTAEDIEQYVSKFYSEEPGDKACNLFERIQTSDVLLDLARSPMLLLLMCVLWRDDSSLPDTMFRLYSEALRYIFKRKADITPDEIAKVVIAIGKIAFHGLVSPVQLLSFDEREFETSVLDTAIRVGLLTSQRVLKGLDMQNSIQFMHTTFQEFCAAKYFQSLLETDPEKFQKILDQIEGTVKNHPAGFEYLMRFCCGDNETCANTILKTLQQNPFSGAVLKLALVCFFESQSKNFPSVDFISSVLTDAVCIEEYNSDCLNSFMWFLKQVVDQTGGRGSAHLAKVQEMVIRRCNLQRFDAGLTYSMSGMTNLSVLALNKCSLTASNMEHIASSLGNTVGLTLLDLSGNGDLGGSVPLWASHLHILKRLKKLTLEDCHLNRRDVRCLAASAGHIANLENCSVQTDVHHHSPKDDLVWPTNPLVSQTHKETCSGGGIKLNVIECSLTGTEMADIVGAMANRSDLVELTVSRNHGLSSSAALWFHPLKHLKHLERLILSDCSLKSTDIEHIAVSLSDMSTLVKLDLSLNNLGGLAVSWAPHVKVIQHLQRLNLKYCSLTGEDVKHMAISLSSLSTLAELDLSCNEALGGSAATWAPYLEQMRYLQKLYLRQCALTGEDVKHIAMPLSDLTKCVELNLSSNEQLGDAAATWCPHLMSMQHLKNLELRGCNLNKQDIKYLATSFGCMPNLVECSVKSAYFSGRLLVQPTKTGIRLDLSQRSLTGKDLADVLEAMSSRSDLVEFILSGNDAVSGSAVLWCPYLKQLKHLERLELHHCSLQRTDIEHISATLRDMESLTKLDLSLNDTLGGSGKAWSPHLKQIKHLQMLDLSSCALTGVDMKHIAVSLGDMPNLMELKLSHNDPLGGSASLWSSYLQSLSHLQTLELDECNFKRQEFKYVAASIGRMGNLVNCSVRSNYMGGRFKCLVQPISTGVQVSLSERSLTGTDLADILEELSTRADLVELSLIGNDALKGSASSWSPCLMHLKHLQLLVLKRCSLQSADIDHIAVALSAMPALVELELSGNKALGGTGETWAPCLQLAKHLQKLHLSSCSLACEDVKHVAVACSVMPTLSELDLSCNETLSGSAALWAPCLKQNQHLHKLFLGACLLTGEDEKCIAMSLSDTTHCYY